MLTAIPSPADYEISPELGFLPAEPPLSVLPDPYYAKWNYIAQDLQSLQLCNRLRAVVDELPVLCCCRLNTTSELRRAYSTLAFVCHAYIWGGDQPAEVVPPSLSIPFVTVCQKLDIPPVATYAAVVLWNFRPVFPAESPACLENLTTLMTFTGSLDESWFYLISVAIEARGGPLIPLMLGAIQAARENDTCRVSKALQDLANGLVEISSLMQRIYEKCDPHAFYHSIRRFLGGSKNMEEAGLVNGVIFDDGTGTTKPVQLSGGSNAQSSLIQFFDIVLGVDHQPSGAPRSQNPIEPTSNDADTCGEDANEHTAKHPESNTPSDFIHDMREYMPGPHRRFLRHVAQVSNIRQFVRNHPEETALNVSYDACLAALVEIRNKHLEMVTRYIILQSQQARKLLRAEPGQPMRVTEPVTPPHSDCGSSDIAEEFSLHGTGGTTLIPFLKQVRDKTVDTLLHKNSLGDGRRGWSLTWSSKPTAVT